MHHQDLEMHFQNVGIFMGFIYGSLLTSLAFGFLLYINEVSDVS